MKCLQRHLASDKDGTGARLEEVALRCHELLFMITEQEPALEFVLLHIYHYILISEFWAKVKGCSARPIKSDRIAICDLLKAGEKH